MNPIHRIVLDRIKNTTDYSKSGTLSDDQLLRKLFLNYRSDTGIRLSAYGLDVLSKLYTGTEVSIAKKATLKHILTLEAESRFPYFLSDKKIVSFDNMLSVKLKLFDGDFDLIFP